MKDYVFDHDFGYGMTKEKKELNKLTLNDFFDLQLFVESHIRLNLDADIKGNVVEYLSGTKEEFFVKKI